MASQGTRHFADGGRRRSAVLLLALVVLAGCASSPVRIGPQPPPSARLFGEAKGSGCGFLLLNLVPFGVNGRVESAYESARVASGQRDITDTKVVERWYAVPLLGTLLCTDLEGTAVE